MEEALDSLRDLPYQNLGFAQLDHHRALRTGFPEVIYCPGKTTDHILTIMEQLSTRSHIVLATRISPEAAQAAVTKFPSANYHSLARTVTLKGNLDSPTQPTLGKVLVIAAGTADMPVAEEACVTLEAMGSPYEKIYDVGVAGLHRLLNHLPKLRSAHVVIVVAGMEGALPSVVAGLVARPVVAVPTSIGYGANFQGLSALLTMLNSCASGIGVVNIDNGYGAACLAHSINLAHDIREAE